MSNSVAELRGFLFGVLEGLKSGAIPVDKAKVMSEVGQTIINSAKVEVDYIKATDANTTGFFLVDEHAQKSKAIKSGTLHELELNGQRVVKHRIN